MPHRSQDLKSAIVNLQLGPFAPRVHTILDRHLSALPPNSEQGKSDLMWRLAIHRMDLRQYTISDASEPKILDAQANAGETAKLHVRLEPKAVDPDVQTMVDESAAEFGAMNARLGVLMWGLQVFERKNGNYDPSRWREKLAEARTMDRETEHSDGSQHAPGFVAAVCVRDHWDEMSINERDSCVDLVCSEISRNSDQWSHLEHKQRFSMAADRPCASVVSLLLNKSLSEPQMQRVRQALAMAITHPIEEVQWYATSGIDGDFWGADRVVAMRCVNAIATEATLFDEAWEAEQVRLYNERRQVDDIRAATATTVREHFWQEGAIADDAHITVDISTWSGAEASARMLQILGQVPNDPAAVNAFVRASRTLVDCWDARDDRNFHAETAVEERLQQFVMRTTSTSALQVLRPVLDAIDRHPREIHSIVQRLTGTEDSNPNTAQYWYLWGLFADAVRRAKWVARLDDEHSIGREMLSAIFLTSWWKDDVRHWRSLEGHADQVHALFEALTPSSIVLDDYVRFLYHIGERSLPEAFVRVANSLKRGHAQAMLAKSNTVFHLEVLLQRHVYGRPLELKRDTAVRQAVLVLLDILVENGSSAAFRMRDDFVTPAA